MGVIRVHEFTTLDGVIDAPTWSFEFPFDPKMGEAIAEIVGGCQAILLGRNTFEVFAPAWSKRTATEDPGAPFMNDTRKFVVATRSPSVEWNNSSVIGPYDPSAIRRLKEQVDGSIYVSGSEHARPGAAVGWPRRRSPLVRLPGGDRPWPAAVRRRWPRPPSSN